MLEPTTRAIERDRKAGQKSWSLLECGVKFEACRQEHERRVGVRPPQVIEGIGGAGAYLVQIGVYPGDALVEGTLADLVEVAAIGEVDFQPIKARFADLPGMGEQEQRADEIFPVNAEMCDIVNAPAPVTVLRDPEAPET